MQKSGNVAIIAHFTFGDECVAQMYLNRTLIQYMHIQAIMYPIYCMRTDSDYIYATHSDKLGNRILHLLAY